MKKLVVVICLVIGLLALPLVANAQWSMKFGFTNPTFGGPPSTYFLERAAMQQWGSPYVSYYSYTHSNTLFGRGSLYWSTDNAGNLSFQLGDSDSTDFGDSTIGGDTGDINQTTTINN